jgi:hypothetical protein
LLNEVSFLISHVLVELTELLGQSVVKLRQEDERAFVSLEIEFQSCVFELLVFLVDIIWVVDLVGKVFLEADSKYLVDVLVFVQVLE